MVNELCGEHFIAIQWYNIKKKFDVPYIVHVFVLVLELAVWISNMPCVHRSFYSFGCTAGNKTEFLESATLTEEEFQERPIINWDAILYVNRPTELWAVQLILALISLTEAMLLTYLGYKVSNSRLSLSFSFLSISILFHSLSSIHFFLSFFIRSLCESFLF